jgi:hypothetical protein
MYSSTALDIAYGDDGFTLQAFREEVFKRINDLKLEYTIDTLSDYFTTAARIQYHDEEINGVDIRILRILDLVK